MPRAGKVCRIPRCPAPAGPQGTCTEHTLTRHERGYGSAHVRRRDELLKALVPGTPCSLCGLPMYAWQKLHAGHTVALRDDPAAVADCLQHEACNEATNVNGRH
jgi:hypothetical protein